MIQPYETAMEGALARLHSARAALIDEIANYPAPISGCDAQFNQLLADRRRISTAIRALEHMPFVPTPRELEPGASLESR